APGDAGESTTPERPTAPGHSDVPDTSDSTETATNPFTQEPMETATRDQRRGVTVSLPYSRNIWTRQSQSLPQTNEHSANWGRGLGAILLLALSYLGYGAWRRH